MARRRQSTGPRTTHLCVKVAKYEVRSEASINPSLRPGNAPRSRDETVFVAETSLCLFGQCTHPLDRATEFYEVNLGSLDAADHDVKLRYGEARDDQVRDDTDTPLYHAPREGYRTASERPRGLGLLHRESGNEAWTFWAWTAPRIVSDWLTLLGNRRDLFITIEEVEADRRRWVRSISLRTSDPFAG